MIQRIGDFILAILLFFIFMVLIIISYFLIVDIQSNQPKETSIFSTIQEKKYQGRKVFIVTPEKKKTEEYILYFHGGSYVAETSMAHWGFLQELANDSGMTIILPDYPLTPKYTYEDVFKMVYPLYQDVIKTIPPEKIIMMGDSAGGGLALALEEKLAEEKITLPKQLILISPWLDTRMNNEKIKEIEKLDQDLNKEALKLAGIAYAGKLEVDNYLINPIDGPLNQLKNVTIFTGTYDILNPDVDILKERAKEKGVTIQIKEYAKAGHIWIVKKKEKPNELAKEGYQELLKVLGENKE